MNKSDLEILLDEWERKSSALEAQLKEHMGQRDYIAAQWADDQLQMVTVRIRTLKRLLYPQYEERSKLTSQIKSIEARWGITEAPEWLEQMKEELEAMGPERRRPFLDSDHLLGLLEEMATGIREQFSLRVLRYQLLITLRMQEAALRFDIEVERALSKSYRDLELSELRLIGFEGERCAYHLVVPSFNIQKVPEAMEILARLTFDVLHLSGKNKVELML